MPLHPLKLTLTFSAALMGVQLAHAEIVTDLHPVLYDTETPDRLYISDPIDIRTPVLFSQALVRYPEVTVLELSGQSDSALYGLVLAYAVRGAGLNSHVPPDAVCASACAYAFFAGVERSAEGAVAVPGLVATDGRLEAGQVALADIVSAFEIFGVPIEVLNRMLSTSVENTYVFQPKELAALGLTGEKPTDTANDVAALRRQLATLEDALAKDEPAAQVLRELLAQTEAALAEARGGFAEAAAAQALRVRLTKAESELTEMATALEEARLEIEETLALRARVADLEIALSEEELARLAEAAAAAALQTRIAELEKWLSGDKAAMAVELDEAAANLTAAEQARLAEAAAAEALRQRLADVETALTEEEQARIAEAAAAEALRARLENADTELTAMTLALEEARKQAEDTLTLLAAAETAKAELDEKLAAALLENETLRESTGNEAELRDRLADALAAELAAEADAAAAMSEAERQAALLATASGALEDEKAASTDAQREMALLNQQMTALRDQLAQLRALLDDYETRDAAAQVQIERLGSDLNAALARVASEERKRAEVEAEARRFAEEEAARLAEEARLAQAQTKDLATYRSEFFGRLRQILSNREGVQIVGDRFVFSSEVLFPAGSADLSPGGQAQIARVAGILSEVANEIPEEIDWMIRVDGHTDKTRVTAGGQYADNWELSQGRALSVVHYMTRELGFPPDRLAATGFGEFQPVALGDSPEAYAANRRIELKLTEK